MTGPRKKEQEQSLTFEVTDTDLGGRVGRLSVNGREAITPCFLPVVHPVRQVIPASELKSMRFEAVMTNSMIAYKRANEDARGRGIHSLIGFEGLLMTDSGGYQALEYGGVDATSSQISEFQAEIGSDLAVTLDRPTGLSTSRSYARETVQYTLKNALETIQGFGKTGTVWVGPIQGGLFLDLLSRSTSRLVEGGFAYLALGSPTQIMENYMFTDLVRMIAKARMTMPYAMPLHLFGAGHPLTMALSVALGCDTFDSASYILFARQERYMTENGVSELRRMSHLPCSCSVCATSSIQDLFSLPREERVRKLAQHNLLLLRKEMLTCREAIVEGRLWDLVEERASAHPRLSAAFHEMARQKELMKVGTPFIKDRGLLLRSETDRQRPELKIVSERLKKVRRRSSQSALLIVQESAPIGRQGLHASLRSRRGKSPDPYRVHPELGLFPAELEFLYPFTQTVTAEERIPDSVVGHAIDELRALGYRRVRAARREKDGKPKLKKKRVRSRRRRRNPSPSARSPSSGSR